MRNVLDITALTLKDTLRVSEIRCVEGGKFFGSGEIVPDRKPETYGIRYRAGKEGDFVTVSNPTAFVRAMLPPHHHKQKKHLKGWLYAVSARHKQTLQKLKDEASKARAVEIEHADAPDYFLSDDGDSDELQWTEKLPVIVDQLRSQYDDAVKALTDGDECTLRMQRMRLGERYAEDSVIVCVVASALGLNALNDEETMSKVRLMAAVNVMNAANRERMELGFLAAGESELQALAEALQVDITLLHCPLTTGHQFELQPDTRDVSEALRTASTTYRAFAASDTESIPARHIVLQTVKRDVVDDNTSELVVDLVTLCSNNDDGDNEDDNMQDDITANDDDNSCDDGSVQYYLSRLYAVLHAIEHDASNRSSGLGTATKHVSVANVKTSYEKINALVQTSKETLQSAKTTHIFLAGQPKAGKSTLGSAFIQQLMNKRPEYYAKFYNADQPVLQHVMVDCDADTDADAMRALDIEMDTRVSHQYDRYKLDRVLSSQLVASTTSAPITIESCGDDVPSITLKFKSSEVVTSVLDAAVEAIQQVGCEVTEAEQKAYTQAIEHALHILGKSNLTASETRAELGIEAPSDSNTADDNDDHDIADEDNSNANSNNERRQ
jgi:hypothetical protein